MRNHRRPFPYRRTAAAVVGVVGSLALVAAASAGAGWQAQVTASSSPVTAGALKVSAAGLNSVAGSFTTTARSVTGSVVVTDTSPTSSTQPADVNLSLSAPAGPAALTSKLTVSAWWTTAAVCDAATVQPGIAATGSWATGLTLTGGSIGRSGSQRACVRTSYAYMQDVASPTATQSFLPVITAISHVRAFTATAPEKVTVLSTVSGIYPKYLPASGWYQAVLNGTSLCIDIANNKTTSGTAATIWTCHATATTLQTNYYNQSFRFATYDRNMTITPRHAPSLLLALNPAQGGSAMIATPALPASTQQWQLQEVLSGIYQIVNDDGRCLTPQNGNAGALLVAADCQPSNSLQKFQLRLSDTKP